MNESQAFDKIYKTNNGAIALLDVLESFGMTCVCDQSLLESIRAVRMMMESQTDAFDVLLQCRLLNPMDDDEAKPETGI